MDRQTGQLILALRLELLMKIPQSIIDNALDLISSELAELVLDSEIDDDDRFELLRLANDALEDVYIDID